MLNANLKTFSDYFKAFATGHPDLKFFCFGSVEKGIAFARSLEEFDYPFLWLEEPVATTIDNGAAHINDRFSVGITALVTAPLDDNDAQIDAYSLGYQIVTDLQAKMRADRKAGIIDMELEGQRKYPVSQLWVDGNFGFRLELLMDLNINATIYKP